MSDEKQPGGTNRTLGSIEFAGTIMEDIHALEHHCYSSTKTKLMLHYINQIDIDKTIFQ